MYFKKKKTNRLALAAENTVGLSLSMNVWEDGVLTDTTAAVGEESTAWPFHGPPDGKERESLD